MAPKKKTTAQSSDRVTRSSARVTRSGARQAKLDPISPPFKKAKISPKKPEAKKGPDSSSVSVKKEEVAEAETETETESKVAADGVGSKKTIIVEHCEQSKLFKSRALYVKENLKSHLDDLVTVVLNPENPRKGCFEIREDSEDGEKFISLLDMEWPFIPMKKLDLRTVVSDIVKKITA